MAVHKRQDLQKVLAGIAGGTIAQVYLLVGDRYLCRDVANSLIEALLPDVTMRSRNLVNIDGSQEDPARTVASLRSFSLFPGRHVYRVTDSRLFYSKEVSFNLWERAREAWAAKKKNQAIPALGAIFNLGGISAADWAGMEIPGLASDDWQKLFGFQKPEEDLEWVDDLIRENGEALDRTAKGTGKGDAGEQLLTALDTGIPQSNVLILLEETVDKRKKLYKVLAEKAMVLDLSVDTGITAAARKDQEQVVRELVLSKLAEYNKKMAPDVLPALLERIGFLPVAAVMETEKLALAVGDAPVITMQNLETLVGRTREDAMFELNEALGSRNIGLALQLVARLREGGLHSLAIIAGMRNFIRRLLVARALYEQQEPSFSPGMSFGDFQKRYLPRLKAKHGDLPALIKGHPFVMYKLLQQAGGFTLPALRQGLEELLQAEYRLKGSQLSESVVLDNVVFGLLLSEGKGKSPSREAA